MSTLHTIAVADLSEYVPVNGWNVIVRREWNDANNFDKGWEEYKQGFGDLNKAFWVGNDYNAISTENNRFKLRADACTLRDTYYSSSVSVFKWDSKISSPTSSPSVSDIWKLSPQVSVVNTDGAHVIEIYWDDAIGYCDADFREAECPNNKYFSVYNKDSNNECFDIDMSTTSAWILQERIACQNICSKDPTCNGISYGTGGTRCLICRKTQTYDSTGLTGGSGGVWKTYWKPIKNNVTTTIDLAKQINRCPGCLMELSLFGTSDYSGDVIVDVYENYNSEDWLPVTIIEGGSNLNTIVAGTGRATAGDQVMTKFQFRPEITNRLVGSTPESWRLKVVITMLSEKVSFYLFF